MKEHPPRQGRRDGASGSKTKTQRHNFSTPPPSGKAAADHHDESVTGRHASAPRHVTSTLPDEIGNLLGGRWPGRLRELFDPAAPKPLAIGLHRAITEACGLDAAAHKALGRLLGLWYGRPSYLRALRDRGAMRHGLDGEPADPVSREHREAAREQLERYRQKYLARKAAARSACRANAALPTLRLERAS